MTAGVSADAQVPRAEPGAAATPATATRTASVASSRPQCLGHLGRVFLTRAGCQRSGTSEWAGRLIFSARRAYRRAAPRRGRSFSGALPAARTRVRAAGQVLRARCRNQRDRTEEPVRL